MTEGVCEGPAGPDELDPAPAEARPTARSARRRRENVADVERIDR